MKKGLGALPVPLQRQVLARVGLSAAAAAAGAGLLVLLRSAAMAAPCLAVALLAAAGAWYIRPDWAGASSSRARYSRPR